MEGEEASRKVVESRSEMGTGMIGHGEGGREIKKSQWIILSPVCSLEW